MMSVVWRYRYIPAQLKGPFLPDEKFHLSNFFSAYRLMSKCFENQPNAGNLQKTVIHFYTPCRNVCTDNIDIQCRNTVQK